MLTQGLKISKTSSKIAKYLREFLEYLEVEKGRSIKTIRNYNFYINRFIDFSHIAEPEEINTNTVRDFRLHLNRTYNNRNEELKRNTQNYHLIALRSLLKYLTKRNIKTLAPEKIELARVGERQVAFLEGGDLERLLEAPLKSNELKVISHKLTNKIIQLRDKALLELLFSTGLRVSELINLKISDVNLKRDEFAVRGKGGKVRVVFLSNQAKYWIGKYLEARGDMSPFLFVRHDRAYKTNTYNRTNKSDKSDDQPLTSRSVQRLIEKYARAAGITKRVTPHVMRHSYATDLLMNGADIRAVQQMLGHSSITTTQIYTHVTDKHLREVFQAFHGKRRRD